MVDSSRSLVHARAEGRCECCRLPEAAMRFRFPIDHIVARQHRGPDDDSNLALCCNRCNSYKGPNLTGRDPESSETTRLFNPRLDRWEEHFELAGVLIIGRTAIGRTTADLLRMNDTIRVSLRKQLADEFKNASE